MLQRQRGEPLWRQVEAALASEIETGILGDGAPLPTEPELMLRFGVSRFTLRQAVASLERRGLVRTEQGRGAVVQRTHLTYPLSRRTRFSRNLIEQGFDPGAEPLLHEIIPAEREVAEALGLRLYAAVVHRRGIGTANETPLELGSIFLPVDRFPDFQQARERHQTLTATFTAYGITDYLRLSTTIETRMPSAEEAAALEQPVSAPVLVVTRIDGDLQGRPILFGRSVWCGARVTFAVLSEDFG
jgi:GntR family phosphonate transport system transcriptional regulator